MWVESLIIVYIISILSAVVLQILFYKVSQKNKNIIFIINFIFALLLSFLIFATLPSSYSIHRLLVLVWAILAVIALAIMLKDEKTSHSSNNILRISIFGSMIQIIMELIELLKYV